MFEEIKEMQKIVAKAVDEARFIHTIGVRDISFSMAIVHGYNEQDALIAGLLHDMAKCLPDETLIAECETYGLGISEDERKAPYLLHGKVGAYYAKVKCNVNDEDILNAITFHTTGRPDMCTLEKIIFVADYIEPGRMNHKIANMQEIRKLAYSNLDKAVAIILKNTIDYLTNKNATIDQTSLEAFEFYSKYIDEILITK